jgi:hypothetical protein
MCHQATYQIDGDTDGGHGYDWQKWMKKCGLPPEQYFSKEKADLLKTPLEKEIEKRQQREREEAKKIKDTKETIPYYQLTTKMPCQYLHNNEWVEALLVSPSGRDRWIVAYEYGAMKIVNENIKKVPEDRHKEIIRKCEYQYERFSKEVDRRKERRDTNKQFRSIAKGLGYR